MTNIISVLVNFTNMQETNQAVQLVNSLMYVCVCVCV